MGGRTRYRTSWWWSPAHAKDSRSRRQSGQTRDFDGGGSQSAWRRTDASGHRTVTQDLEEPVAGVCRTALGTRLPAIALGERSLGLRAAFGDRCAIYGESERTRTHLVLGAPDVGLSCLVTRQPSRAILRGELEPWNIAEVSERSAANFLWSWGRTGSTTTCCNDSATSSQGFDPAALHVRPQSAIWRHWPACAHHTLKQFRVKIIGYLGLNANFTSGVTHGG